KDDVSLKGYSAGGSSLYDDINLLPAANNIETFVGTYGLGDFDAIQLRKLLTGKRVSCSVSVGGLYEQISGASSPDDFELMLQLLYLRFMNPRFDVKAHQVLLDQNFIRVKQSEGQPQKMMQDSITMISSNYNPRTWLFNEEYLNQITLERVEKIYRERFDNVADFTLFIVGNIDIEIAKPLVEKYIGSIKSSDVREEWIDREVRGPEGRVEKVIQIPLTAPRSTVLVSIYKEMDYNLKDSYMISILSNILTNRYTKSIREEQGGTYGVGVNGTVSREPVVTYSLRMNFNCDPAKAQFLKPFLYKEIDNIINEGVTEEELGKVIKNILKEAEQGRDHNSYWMRVLNNYYLTGININDPKNFEEILEAMSPEDVQNFTKRFLTDANVIDLIFKPMDQTQE
ncbi:MAG TPA: insulinase family protein, partial [Methanocorpusculum sp.]|nr:insulinase family protein [Methanocorpusculum sp.]